jgi:hypothetical protein
MISYLLADEVKPEDLTEYVSGSERWKYHKRPLVPMMVEDEERFGMNQEKDVDEYPNLVETTDTEQETQFKHVGVQTVYRDSQTQTLPFSPPEYIPKGANPEVLLLKNRTFGKGLPATMEEMYFIEEAREKISFEGALPPTSDEACFHLRRRLLEDQEKKEWKKRENEIKKVQNERLNLLQSALIVREKDTEEAGIKRIEAIKAKKMEGKNRLVAKIQRKKIKILRKILKTKKNLEKTTNKRDIVEEYYNFASRVYGNITREGLSLDKLSNKFEVQPFSLQTYEAFSELVDMIKPSYLQSNFNLDEYNKKLLLGYTKLETHHRIELKKALVDLTGENRNQNKEEKVAKDDGFKEDYIARPDTPIGHRQYQDMEKHIEDYTSSQKNTDSKGTYMKLKEDYQKWYKKEEAIILFQRLIEGRAVQNLMFEGKEKRLALIAELLIVSNIDELDKEKEQELLVQQHQQRIENAFIEGLQGETIAETLEGLSKELLRFKEEKKIAGFVMKAEEERRKREAEETGRRQAELTLRDREDVLYTEIMKVHQGTIDSYLRKIMARSVDHLARKQALKMTRLQGDKVDNTIQDSRRQQVVIRDLVSSLLIPNVDREKMARRVQLEQKRYNEAVKQTLTGVMKEAKNLI